MRLYRPVGDHDDHFLPTAQGSGSYQMWVLVALYFLVAVWAFVGFVASARSRSSSFRSAFLGFSSLMLMMRCVFLTFSIPGWEDHPFLLYQFYLLTPTFLQLVMFNLLILYVIRTQMVLHQEDHKIRSCLYPLFYAVHGVFYGCMFIFSFFLARMWDNMPDDQWGDFISEWDQIPSIVNGVCYFILTVVGIHYSFKVHHMLKIARQLVLTPTNSRRIAKLTNFLIMIPIFFLLFLLRAVWGTLYFLDINPLQDIVSELIRNGNTNTVNYYIFCFYVIIEWAPISAVVIVFTTMFRAEDKEKNTAFGKRSPFASPASRFGSGSGSPIISRGFTSSPRFSRESSQSYDMRTAKEFLVPQERTSGEDGAWINIQVSDRNEVAGGNKRSRSSMGPVSAHDETQFFAQPLLDED
jgi:hypothetical protein